jgi:3-(3-hydroxy-phenyl)propionate hydroxylase
MLSTYAYPRYAAPRAPELDAPGARHHARVVVVGAGPVGLAAAIDLALQGVAVTLLDEDDTVSIGSRGLCYAQRTLEVLDRLGVGDAVVAKGVTWNVGRTFHRDTEVFRFELQPEPDHQRPGMVNLQQYWLEQFLVERALHLPNLALRFRHRVAHVEPRADGAVLQVATPDGAFTLRADWLIVADGARSPIRRQLGLELEGRVFRDRFLIADVVMKTDLFPAGQAERWFWFDPPFHPGQSVLLHKEADDVWRIDFQLGEDADPEAEKQPERVLPRVRALLEQGLGREAPAFELEWASVYTFQCRRMASFRHGRLLFAGDAAHQVSPFGARGANSGIQDADNLVWKLKAVLDGHAPEALLDSYSAERGAAADENILHSTRSTDFITPRSAASRALRDAVLTLAREHPFARGLVNSGRLSVPTHLVDSPLNTPDHEAWDCAVAPGSPLPDAPVRQGGHDGQDGWLLRHTGGAFQLLLFEPTPASLGKAQRALIGALAALTPPVHTLLLCERDAPNEGPAQALPAACTLLLDTRHRAAQRLDASPGSAVLLRPDQHLAARWRVPTLEAVQAALARACGHAGAFDR